MSLAQDSRPQKVHPGVILFPALFLCGAYSLLGLTFLEHPGNLMDRCVLMNLNLARIWSVAHVEIGMSYLGVFLGMTYYLIRAGRLDKTHFRDLGLAFTYLILSFLLDYACVRYFTPFRALLIGDAVVMTFTLMVSKQLWFQRLLGIFVPLVFLTCAFGHLLEGMSFWQLTYPVNVPWTMVTADIGFAILVNASRFPAFIRGHDLENEMLTMQSEIRERQRFFKDVLTSVTDGKLRLASDFDELPKPSLSQAKRFDLLPENLSEFRKSAKSVWQENDFPIDREPDMLISVGEAIMNAVVHGKKAVGELHAEPDTFQVWISDHGPGIRLDHLPRATLEKGYSTAGSLGHGFYIMLQTVDRLDIVTNSTGTTLVLSFDRVQKQPAISYLG